MADIQIINRVYNLLGRNHQDSSISDAWGQIISNTIDAKLKVILESNTWSFAIKYSSLARVSTTTNPTFTYSYNLPNDCFKVIEPYVPTVNDSLDSVSIPLSPIDYEILGNKLYTNELSILIKYKVGSVDIIELPQSFIDALAYLSASELSMNLLENAQLSSMFAQTYQRYLFISRSNDVQNGRTRRFNVRNRNY
tara:strand:- start:5579 stop:6163 length:585 start_codon:yes stop_codon:yes gene_type:complete